jgi:uncharacterized membrane protein YbhN (UPF0104 family)/tRNA A-37 threonylcarbamoyl transferase component Bud32
LVGTDEQPRARRATDVILLVSSALGLALLGALAVPPPGIEQSFGSFVSSVPSGLDGLWRLMIAGLAAWSFVIAVASATLRRWPVLRDLLLAASVALCASLVLGRIVVGARPAVWDSLRSVAGTEHFPPLGIAVPAAMAITASPHLRKPARHLGRWLIVLALLGVVLYQSASPTGAAAGLLMAAASAAVVHLLFGSSMGRPSLDDVQAALSGLGVPAYSLGVAERQPAGVFVVDATDQRGERLLVKVYGRDAHDTQLVTTVWRKIWYREAGVPGPAGRLQQAEHEALLTVLAHQAGIRTDHVVTAGATKQDDVLLALRRTGQSLDEIPERWSDTIATGAWRAVRRLHDSQIAHGQVDNSHLLIDGEHVGLVDFRGAAIAPEAEQLHADQAQLLVSSALALGPERAIAAARTALAPEELSAALSFVQVPALTVEQRRAVREKDLDLDELRAHAASEAGIDAPELRKLRRVTLGSVLQVALLLLAFVALASGLGDLDFQELAEQLKDATYWLVAVGFLIAQLPRVTSALSVIGASPVPLALRPVYALQLAASYLALAIPSSAARVAINVRFFQRHGLPTGSALAVGGLDGVAQFVVQALMLITTLLLTSTTLNLSLGGDSSGNLGLLVLIVVAVAVVAALVLALVPKWRRAVFGQVRTLVREALAAVRGLRSPRRVALLVFGNVATELLFAIALQTFVRAIGYHVGLAEVVLINVSVSLLAGLLPIPGGIGVVEGGLTYGLVRAGVPEEAAFAAVLLHRLATFYLPPIWGFFAFRWLERNKQI